MDGCINEWWEYPGGGGKNAKESKREEHEKQERLKAKGDKGTYLES